MKDRIIPQLRRKFRLLVEYGHFANLDEIALALGKRPGTIKSWADGGDRWEAGLIPRASYDDVIRLFGSAIARHHEIFDVEAIVKERMGDLEELFKPLPFTLSALIEREAMTENAILIKKASGIDLVEVSNTPRKNPKYSVRQGELFRVVFEKVGAGSHIIALQNMRQDWGFVPAVLEATLNEIMLPGFESDGIPAHMREHHWIGLNRFIVIQCDMPFPQKIITSIEGNLPPDNAILRELAEFYNARPIETRKLFLLSVLIEKSMDTAGR